MVVNSDHIRCCLSVLRLAKDSAWQTIWNIQQIVKKQSGIYCVECFALWAGGRQRSKDQYCILVLSSHHVVVLYRCVCRGR
jgi:hypothetical protein